jgi:uncharacterized protein YndB with AHSA1/START domain
MNAAVSPAQLELRRTIDAPPQVLFAAWLDAASVAQWMHPGPTLRTDATIDARVGGAFQIDMHTPDGLVPHHGQYLEIVPHTRLVFTWVSPHTFGQDSLVTITFTPKGRATEIHLVHERLPAEKVAAHNGGWTGCLDGLATFAASASSASAVSPEA